MSLIIGFCYLLVRLLAIVFIAPILGHQSVSAPIRVTLALAIALTLAPGTLPQFAAATENFPEVSDVVYQCFNEAIIGIAIGLGILTIFSAAIMIAATINQLSGLQMESVFGSSSGGFGQNPTTQLIGLTTACVFILSGGLELSLATAMESFQSLPIGEAIAGKSTVTMITAILQQSFELTVRAVAPAITALIVSTVLVGIISRTLPQLNLIQVGLSTNVGLMLTAAFLTLGGCAWMVVDDVERVSEMISQTLPSFLRPPES